MMATTVLPVPTILNILQDTKNSYMVDQNVEEPPQRAKKRRLDHLSWEEKMQRKKLKNRVAAQTSRDRKKAKQEQMESAIQQLFTKNETLLAECEKLRELNERLQAENTELHQRLQFPTMPVSKPDCRVRARERINRVPPSTERNGRGHSSGFDQRLQGGPAEDGAGLPSLPDLLDELESDAVDLNALEQLTQTLLEDIARDLESAAEKAADQESTPNRKNDSGEVVGSPSKQLESSGTEELSNKKSLEYDISEYLLLHHNYAKKHPKETTKTPVSTKKLKTIRPKVGAKNKLAVDNKVTESEVKLQENTDELMYGTFDENTNTITIVVNEDVIPVNEVVVGEGILNTPVPMVIDTNNSLTVQTVDAGNLSPRSDLGYESLDSPVSNCDIEHWDQSVSELFPSLF